MNEDKPHMGAGTRDKELTELWEQYREKERRGQDTVEIRGMIIGLEREVEEAESPLPPVDSNTARSDP